MKRTPLLALIVMAIASVAISAGCSSGEKVELVSEDKGPAAKATQQISTPTLKKPKTSEKTAEEAEAKAKEEAAKKEEESKEHVPGTPRKTPSIPKDIAKGEMKEEALPSEPAAEGPKAAPAPMPTPEAVEEIIAEEVATAPTLIADATAIDIVLDASGSMDAPYAMTGRSKYEIVRGALEDILLSASEQRDVPRNIGVRLFGAGSPFVDNNCKDTKSAVDVGPLDFNAIAKALTPVTPQGTSPPSHCRSSMPQRTFRQKPRATE